MRPAGTFRSPPNGTFLTGFHGYKTSRIFELNQLPLFFETRGPNSPLGWHKMHFYGFMR